MCIAGQLPGMHKYLITYVEKAQKILDAVTVDAVTVDAVTVNADTRCRY